ncbi:hypothetical protein VNO77_05223 [Canavalia gladiata]|uniref:TF-B3 domain-containing protein n=1 Tax=Canavalia gladiata TaxID=3824 RepID=A0AAN9R9T0_CANGL
MACISGMCSSGSSSDINSGADAPTAAKRRTRKTTKQEERRSWDCTTDLMLYDDPWKIKKKLKESDIGNLSRLLLPKELVEDLVLPVLSPEACREADTEKGTQVMIWDLDTQSMNYLVFKFWTSSGSYVFIDGWTKNFVNRRALKKGDEIGLQWNPYNNCFNFSILFQITHIPQCGHRTFCCHAGLLRTLFSILLVDEHFPSTSASTTVVPKLDSIANFTSFFNAKRFTSFNLFRLACQSIVYQRWIFIRHHQFQ